MTLFNKNHKMSKQFGIIQLVLLVIYLIVSAVVLGNGLAFAKEHNAKLEFEWQLNPDYVVSSTSGEGFDTTPAFEFASSHFKFMRDGKDVVIEDYLYEEFNDLNVRATDTIQALLLIVTLNTIPFSIYIVKTSASRMFQHNNVLSVSLLVISILTWSGFAGRISVTLIVVPIFIGNIYFASRQRICENSENKLTGIFKKAPVSTEEYVNIFK